MENDKEKLKHFEKKLKFFAEDKFGSLGALAEQLQKSPSYLTRIVKQKVKPNFYFFIELFKLGCNINWLLDDNREDLDYNVNNIVVLTEDEKKLIADIRMFTEKYGSIVNIIPGIKTYIDNQKSFQEKTLGADREK